MMGWQAILLYFPNYFIYGCHDVVVQEAKTDGGKMDFLAWAHPFNVLKAL